MKKIHWLIFSLMIFSLAGCGISLASDITPPPNYQPPSNVEPVIQETVSPLIPPNLRNGKVIYAAKCVDCHGESGMGNGAQADQLPVPVAPIGNFDFVKDARPSDWYQIITVGNLEKFMPGFTSLSDRERWDVAAYALSLSFSQDDLDLGSAVFLEHCGACHQKNNVDGNLDFTKPEDLSDLSLAEIAAIIQNGKGSSMSGFDGILSEDETWAAATYIRRLGFEGSEELPVVENESQANDPMVEEAAEENLTFDLFSVKGELTNLDSIMENQTVVLTGYDGMDQAIQLESQVDQDGTYEFVDLEYVVGRVYQIVAIIDGIQHSSEVFHNPVIDENGYVDIPVIVMASTMDASDLYAERMHIFFEFIDPQTIQVVELLVVQNPTDLVVVAKDMNTPIVEYKLPDGATNLQFEEGSLGDRYILTEEGFGDLQPIEPNIPKQFLFAYNLPYENKMTLDIDLPMDVEATIVMLPSGVGVDIESDLLNFTGERSMQGAGIKTYSSARLSADQNLTVNFQGKYKIASSNTEIETSDSTGIIIGVAIFLISIGVGFVLLRGKKTSSSEEESLADLDIKQDVDINDLLDSIISLDQAYAKGELPEDAYINRRKEFVDQISSIQGEQ